MPPMLATSATPSISRSWNRTNQSCSARSWPRSFCPVRSTRAYWKAQPTPVASGPSVGVTPAGSRPVAWLRYSSVRERAQ